MSTNGAQTTTKKAKKSPTTGPVKARRSGDYFGEDVLKYAREAFAETVALKVEQLRRLIPRKKEATNPAVTGSFVEELVRGFVKEWIGTQRLVHGTFYSQADAHSKEKALQIDGIVHDARRGPAIITEGDFAIVHPAFCAGVIEIKATVADLKKFERRLQMISGSYLHHVPASRVMGVVIASDDPETDSVIPLSENRFHYLYNYRLVGWCPIFVLFQEKDGKFLPYHPAIDALIRATRELVVTTNYL